MNIPEWSSDVVRERADVSCLICGRGLGQIERAEGKIHLIEPPETVNAAHLVRKSGVGMACSHCGGRAYVGPLERIARYAA